MRAKADAGEPVEIEANGRPRYIFKLARNVPRERLTKLLERATRDLNVSRDKSPLRRR